MPLHQILQEAPTGVFLAAEGLAGAIAGVGLFVALRSLWQMRALRSVATVSAGSIAPGYVRVEGSAESPASGTLTAPLTGAACCWYRMRVEDSAGRGSGSRGGSGWYPVRSEESDSRFLVRDDGGTVMVDPSGADVTPTDKSLWYGAGPEPEDRNPQRLAPGENPKGKLVQIEWSDSGSHRYRYSEERIYPGDRIYVQGECAEDEVDEDDEEEEQREAAGGDAAVQEARRDVSTGVARCIRKPSQRTLPYLIATTSPEKMTEIYRWGIAGSSMIALFGLALALGIAWLRFS
jgi:hypothetical protein